MTNSSKILVAERLDQKKDSEESLNGLQRKSPVDVTLWIGIIAFVVFSTAFILIQKKTNNMLLPKHEGGKPEPFNAPILQGGLGNLSEFISFPFYVAFEIYYKYKYNKSHGSRFLWNKFEKYFLRKKIPDDEYKNCKDCDDWNQPSYFGFVLRSGSIDRTKVMPKTDLKKAPKPRTPFYYWTLPAWIGFTGSIFKNMSLQYMSAADVSFFCQLTIPLVAIFAIWFLKKKLYLFPHGIAVLFVALGGVVFFINTKIHAVGAHASDMTGIPYILITIVCYAVNNIWHEQLMENYDTHPIEIIALDSASSFLYVIVILCSTNLEDTMGSLYQIGSSSEMMMLIAVYVIVHAPAQLLQYFIIGRSSAVMFNIANQIVPIAVWIVQLCILQNITFQYLMPIGYILVALGAFFYGYIIPIRKWVKLQPPIEAIIEDNESVLQENLLKRYIAGDGYSIFSKNFCTSCFGCPNLKKAFCCNWTTQPIEYEFNSDREIYRIKTMKKLDCEETFSSDEVNIKIEEMGQNTANPEDHHKC